MDWGFDGFHHVSPFDFTTHLSCVSSKFGTYHKIFTNLGPVSSKTSLVPARKKSRHHLTWKICESLPQRRSRFQRLGALGLGHAPTLEGLRKHGEDGDSGLDFTIVGLIFQPMEVIIPSCAHVYHEDNHEVMGRSV